MLLIQAKLKILSFYFLLTISLSTVILKNQDSFNYQNGTLCVFFLH